MADETPPEILGSLPRTRPHRRSAKRRGRAESTPKTVGPERAKASKARRSTPRRRPRAEPLRQPGQPSGTPPAPRSRRPIPASGTELLSTVVQATAELAEIGLSASARAVRSTIGRLPKP